MTVKHKESIALSERTSAPKAYCCVLYNDDITTMDFVVMALVKVFNKSTFEASQIMMHIHNYGKERVGRYCYDIALSKKSEIDALARSHDFPLITKVEEADD